METLRMFLGVITLSSEALHFAWLTRVYTIAVLVTEGMVLLGGLLLLSWCAPGRPSRSGPAKPPPSVPAPSDDEGGELEITIEPLSRPYGE